MAVSFIGEPRMDIADHSGPPLPRAGVPYRPSFLPYAHAEGRSRSESRLPAELPPPFPDGAAAPRPPGRGTSPRATDEAGESRGRAPALRPGRTRARSVYTNAGA